MLSKLREFNRACQLIRPGDRIVCAVSGGADSMALLFGLYLLKDEWRLDLSAAHFNHHLRGAESDRDEQFVRDFCAGYGIPLHVGSAHVAPGPKGLEAAARDARYAYLRTLPGKIATAHTADDNAETVLMHLVRGTGLKGLGGIMPVNGNVIRPMLNVTRADVEDFLEEYCVSHITDSSNDTDDFLRNRLRHQVMPLLKAENPRLVENLSATALRLRLDEQALSNLACQDDPADVPALRAMAPAVRARALERFLKDSGVREPEAAHIALAETLVFSGNPSARAHFPGGITIGRRYDRLTVLTCQAAPEELPLPLNGTVRAGDFEITCREADEVLCTTGAFTVRPDGPIILRPRLPGDRIRLSGGTKSLKKLFIDRKIPAAERSRVPVIADDSGVIAVCGIGASLDRVTPELPAVLIEIKPVTNSES
ncbi:MAG: tRNA lysidine(34) synthetase TilS [Oscillospiraceae bacterium]|nr:tRNA lysidine(34) synthetase TilS [Oscillospiraceae bacterium]